MSDVEPGTRVIAISHSDAKTKQMFIFGHGIYEGTFVPKEAAGPHVPMMIKHKIPNPRIKLDNGQYVFGCECWWGPEDIVRKKAEGYDFVNVDIQKTRDDYHAWLKKKNVEMVDGRIIDDTAKTQ